MGNRSKEVPESTNPLVAFMISTFLLPYVMLCESPQKRLGKPDLKTGEYLISPENFSGLGAPKSIEPPFGFVAIGTVKDTSGDAIFFWAARV